MKANTLCTLLAQRIPPEQFQVRGDKVIFFDPDANNKLATAMPESPYDTPENRAIVEDVITNYGPLEAAYLAEELAEKEAAEALQTAKQQSLVDNLPSWFLVNDAINNIANLADAKAFIKKLSRVVYLDLKNSVD